MSSLNKGNRVGMRKSEIETPILMVDLELMDRNLEKMATYFSGVKAKLRPHTKTHKTPALAHKQIQAGAIGVCCGTLQEAETMISAGIGDVLVTREVVSTAQLARVAGLARHADIKLVVDNMGVVERLSEAAQSARAEIGVMVDVDVALGRTGVPPGEPACSLSKHIHGARGLRYMGLMGYEGSMHGVDASERERRCKRSLGLLMETKQLIERDGIEVKIVSAGATSTYTISGTFPGITEVQAGSYLTMDSEYHGFFPEFECALAVLTTVVSRPSATRVTTDAGKKKLTEDAGLPQPRDGSGISLVALHEEHGILELVEPTRRIQVGDTLEIIPSHGCTTFNLYDQLYGFRDDRLEVIWDIAGRGT